MKPMWTFKTPAFIVRWEIESDVLDTSFMEPSLAQECRRNVRSGKWKCFASRVVVTCRVTKKELGEAYLCNSVYKNPAEFRDHFGMNHKGHGSYFSDMVREAIQQARAAQPKHLQTLQEDAVRLARTLKRFEKSRAPGADVSDLRQIRGELESALRESSK